MYKSRVKKQSIFFKKIKIKMLSCFTRCTSKRLPTNPSRPTPLEIWVLTTNFKQFTISCLPALENQIPLKITLKKLKKLLMNLIKRTRARQSETKWTLKLKWSYTRTTLCLTRSQLYSVRLGASKFKSKQQNHRRMPWWIIMIRTLLTKTWIIFVYILWGA